MNRTSSSSQRTVTSSTKNRIVTINTVCAGPRPVWLSETSQGHDLLRKVSGEVGIIGTLNDHEVDDQTREGEESETVNREDKAQMTPFGDV